MPQRSGRQGQRRSIRRQRPARAWPCPPAAAPAGDRSSGRLKVPGGCMATTCMHACTAGSAESARYLGCAQLACHLSTVTCTPHACCTPPTLRRVYIAQARPLPAACFLSPEQEAACSCLDLTAQVRSALGSNIYIVAADTKRLKMDERLHYGPEPFGEDFTGRAALWVCKHPASGYELLACHLPAHMAAGEATKLYAEVRSCTSRALACVLLTSLSLDTPALACCPPPLLAVIHSSMLGEPS